MKKKYLTELKPFIKNTGITYSQDKLLKLLMNPKLHKQFINNFYFSDWYFIVKLLYYVKDSPDKEYLKSIKDLAEKMEPELSSDLHELDNNYYEALQPYLSEIDKLSEKEALIYGTILKDIANAYKTIGIAEDRKVAGEQLDKAGQLLVEYNLEGYNCYVLEGNKLYGWWE